MVGASDLRDILFVASKTAARVMSESKKDILPEKFGSKNGADIVTIADLKTEEAINDFVLKFIPNCNFLVKS